MFFQAADEQQEAAKNAAKAVTDFSKVKQEISQMVGDLDSIPDVLTSIGKVFEKLIIQSEELNKTFVGGRTRIQEMQKAINDAAPDVVRLGGTYEEVGKTISEIAAGTRTQVVATAKDVRELFAAGEVLNLSVLNIVDAFDKVGISYNTVADNLEKSIVYVQSVGQNARAVMKDVVSNTEQLSRFNFANGVQGLTKMAAQASMLRFDMKQTFEFADKLIDPEKAIETASAFQRLGVSVGNLTDPFQLMNQSIMDPSGLQTSLINMTKQFTYFDEQTKSFKINPQGILTMKAIAEETNLSASELRKTAIAAAEMDSKLAQINTTGLNFEVSEENKMLLANVARMGEGGAYEVSIKDERGYEYQKKLTELQEEDFKRLIEQQQKAPKSIEEIQRSQLNVAELTLSEMKGLRETITASFLGLPGMQSGVEGAANLARDITKVGQKALQMSEVRDKLRATEAEADKIRSMKLKPEEEKKQLNELFKKSKEEISALAPQVFRAAGVEMKRVASEQGEQVSEFVEYITETFGLLFGETKGRLANKMVGSAGETTATGTGYGMLTSPTASTSLPAAVSKATGIASARSTLDVDFKNPTITVNVNVNAPSGMDGMALTQVIKDAQNPLKEEIYNAVRNVAIAKGQIKTATV